MFLSPRPPKSLENLRSLRKNNSNGPEHEAPKFKRGDAEGTEGVIEGLADPERQDLSPQSAHDPGRETGSCHPGLLSLWRTLGLLARTTAMDLDLRLLSSRGDAEGTEGVIEGWADLERQDLAPQSAHDPGRETGSCHPGCAHKEPEAHKRHLVVKG